MKTFLQISLTHFWGGAEIYCIRLCKTLISQGVSLHFLCSAQSPLSKELAKHNIPFTSIESRSYFNPIASLKIRKLVDRLNVSSILIHSFKDAWLVTPALWGKKDVNYYGIFHIINQSNKKDIFHRLIYSRFDKVIATTHLQINYLLKTNPFPRQKFIVIPYMVDIDFFNPHKRKNLFEGKVVIGCIGRISPEKGQREFVEAISQIKDLPVMALIIGKEHPKSRDYYLELQNYVAENLKDKVIFIDHTEDISTYMASLDIFVMPSHLETFGIVLLEAMASGTATISTDAGGVPEILDFGHAGLVLKLPQLAQGIRHLVLHPQERKKLAENGYQRAKQHYSRNIIELWKQIL